MEITEKLALSWPVIKWLDDARWANGESSSLIPGNVFASLSPSQKILAHWLCYITDQQRPWRQVWYDGGPVFAELTEQYEGAANTENTFDLLLSYTESNRLGKVDSFKSKKQMRDGEIIVYTPRYGIHMLSIALTLSILNTFGNDIINYLYSHAGFVYRHTPHEDDSRTLRIVFLLYLLSYDGIIQGMTSYHEQRNEFINILHEKANLILKLVEANEKLEEYYVKWINNRFHKRLWAAFRDYVKPGSFHEPIFLKALRQLDAERYVNLLEEDRQTVLRSLELPGDVWNLHFNKRLFDSKINSPRDLRNHYKRLRAMGQISDDFYPEQFDVSWDFAPRMCDRADDSNCPFKRDSKLDKYCFRNSGNGKFCPIVKILCGYDKACIPQGCPMIEGKIQDLCAGCSL